MELDISQTISFENMFVSLFHIESNNESKYHSHKQEHMLQLHI